MVNTSACHAEDRGFKSRRNRHYFFWLCSSVGRAEDWKSSCRQFDSARSHHLCLLGPMNALVAQLDRAFGYEPKGQGFESLRAHHILSGSSTTWQCTWFGTMRLQVQILSSRPFSNQTDFIVCFFSIPKHLSNLPDLLFLKLF